MNHYELLIVLPGTLAEDELAAPLEKAKEIITAEGGDNIRFEDKGKNRLTYPMKHIRYGYFFLGFFEAEPAAIAEIQKKLGMTKIFLRTLINAHNPEKKQMYDEAMQAFEKRKARFAGKGNEPEEKKKPVKEGKKQEEKTEKKEEKKEEKKVDMNEINEKLDALLESDLEKV